MHLVYVDESGDPGINNSPTASYILSGLKIPAEHWHDAQAVSYTHLTLPTN
jgi:hypothetical protein